MKKLLYILLGTAATICLSACDDNGQNGGGGNPGGGTDDNVTAEVTYSVAGGEDILSLFDITAIYTDETGSRKEQKLTSLPCDITLSTIETLPFEAAVSLTLTERPEYPDKEKYTVGLAIGISYELSNGKQYGSLSLNTQQFSKDKIDAYKKIVMDKKWESAVTVEE